MTEDECEAVVSIMAGIQLADRKFEPTEAERAQEEVEVWLALKTWLD